MPRPFVAAQVHDDAFAFGRDAFEREVELRAAVAAERSEHVAGQALGVHAHEDVVGARHLAPHERQVLGAVEQRFEHVRDEVAVPRRDAGFGDAPHELLAVAAVADQVRDRDEDETVLVGEGLQVGKPLHRAVVVHDLGEDAGREAARHAGEVDRRLGVARALEHAAVPVAQREDVPGPRQVLGARLRVDERRGPSCCGRPRRCRSWCRASRRRTR